MGFLARNGRLTESICARAQFTAPCWPRTWWKNFSMDRLLELSWEEIDRRYRAFIELTDSHHTRWNSPS